MNIHKKFFSKIGGNYFIYAILSVIFQIILVNCIFQLNPEYITDVNIVTILSSVSNYILPFPILYWLMNKLERVELEKTNINVKTFILYIGISFTLMWIGNITGLIITALLGGAIQNDISNPIHELVNSTSIWLNLILIGIIAPIFEELILRKLIIDRTIKYGAKVSIIISAVIFSLLHANLNQFFYTLLLGGFFAYVYIKTGRIIYSIILHSFINLMGSVVSVMFANHILNIQNSLTVMDLGMILAYFLLIIICLAIGVYGLTKINKARFRGSKTQIALKHPMRTVFLNYGMILFIGYFIFKIISQALA